MGKTLSVYFKTGVALCPRVRVGSVACRSFKRESGVITTNLILTSRLGGTNCKPLIE